MTNIEMIIVILMAAGFGFTINKLNKLTDIASLLVSMQIGKMMVHGDDGETISFSIEEEDEDA